LVFVRADQREIRNQSQERERERAQTLDDAEVCDDEISKVKVFVGTELLAEIDHFVDPLKGLIV